MLNRHSRLKATKPLNRMSLRKIIELNSQADTRIKLCKRASGHHYIETKLIRLNNGTSVELHLVHCTGGFCEVGQHLAHGLPLEPHEDPPRSLGSKVSLEDSKMTCRACHKKQKGQPEWSGKDE